MQPVTRSNADRTHCVFKLYFTDFLSLFSASVLLARDVSVRQYWHILRYMYLFVAHRPLTRKLRSNWALLGKNGNTLNK